MLQFGMEIQSDTIASKRWKEADFSTPVAPLSQHCRALLNFSMRIDIVFSRSFSNHVSR
jgi:hypothetical protein